MSKIDEINRAESLRVAQERQNAENALDAANKSLKLALDAYNHALSAAQAWGFTAREKQRESRREGIRALLRHQSCLSRFHKTDVAYLSPGHDLLRPSYWTAIYEHALAVAGGEDTPDGGRINEALNYFEGEGFTLPRWAWWQLWEEARGTTQPWSGDPLAPITAKHWLGGAR